MALTEMPGLPKLPFFAVASIALAGGYLVRKQSMADEVAARTPIPVASAEPGALGEPDRYGDPRDGITQLRCIDRLVSRLAAQRPLPRRLSGEFGAVGILRQTRKSPAVPVRGR